MNDLISKSALLEEIDKYCGEQRYLLSEGLREIIANQPIINTDINKEKREN